MLRTMFRVLHTPLKRLVLISLLVIGFVLGILTDEAVKITHMVDGGEFPTVAISKKWRGEIAPGDQVVIQNFRFIPMKLCWGGNSEELPLLSGFLDEPVQKTNKQHREVILAVLYPWEECY